MKIKTKNDNLMKMSTMKIYSKDVYKFSIQYEENDISFTVQNAQNFPIKTYGLKISLKEMQSMKYFEYFNYKSAEKFINNVLKKCIEQDKFDIKYIEDEDALLFEFNWEIFENNYAELKIPKKEIEKEIKIQVESFALVISEMGKKINKMEEEKKSEDLKSKIESFASDISEMKEKINKINEMEDGKKTEDLKSKNEAAVKSFFGTSILEDEEKKLISEWIHPNKILKFNLLYSNTRDSDDSSTFHYYCDGVSPTVTVILDTSGRKFGGYSTQSWGQSSVGSSYSRAVGSFIFNLSKKSKYDLSDQLNYQAVQRNNSYGPWFGGGPDIRIASSCRSNTSSSCKKSTYNTGNDNVIGGSGSTSFQVSYYEVYHVVSE